MRECVRTQRPRHCYLLIVLDRKPVAESKYWRFSNWRHMYFPALKRRKGRGGEPGKAKAMLHLVIRYRLKNFNFRELFLQLLCSQWSVFLSRIQYFWLNWEARRNRQGSTTECSFFILIGLRKDYFWAYSIFMELVPILVVMRIALETDLFFLYISLDIKWLEDRVFIVSGRETIIFIVIIFFFLKSHWMII